MKHQSFSRWASTSAVGPQLVAGVRDALTALDGAGEVKVEVTLSPPWSPELMTESGRDELGMF